MIDANLAAPVFRTQQSAVPEIRVRCFRCSPNETRRKLVPALLGMRYPDRSCTQFPHTVKGPDMTTNCFPCLLHAAVLAWIGLAWTGSAPLQGDETEEGFVPMFNGRDLSGWQGAPDWWEARDGAIVAESTPDKPSQRTHYLYWKGGKPADFELRCLYRITGKGGNSGIQFRSETRPNWDTWGYQADFDTNHQYTGFLYQHGRGLVAGRGQQVVIDQAGEKTVTTFADSAELLKAVKDQDWNEYRIVAKGRHIALWINGTRMCEVEDHQQKYALAQGIIALQMHAGPPMRVEFKNLRIRIF
jgi:hypothetical protein